MCRVNVSSLTPSPKSERTWSSTPHASGGVAPGGGGGMNGSIVRKNWPTQPSGGQLAIAIVPPGRATRSSSSATT